MPDWSYQTIFRPLLFALPPQRARDLTLGVRGGLARLPFGSALIDFLGHMRSPAILSREVLGLTFCSPVGLEAGIDPDALGTRALLRFGLGFIELGPVTMAPVDEAQPPLRLPEQEAIAYGSAPANPGAGTLERRLRTLKPQLPLGLRLAHRPGATPAEAAVEQCGLIERFTPLVAFFTVAADSTDLPRVIAAAHQRRRPILLVLPADRPPPEDVLAGADGILIDGAITERDGRRLTGPPAREAALGLLRTLRDRYGPALPIIASGGIHEPADGLRFLDAGATLVQIGSGLVYSGPGLPKRINEALVDQSPTSREQPVSKGWIWGTLLGWGMLLGGLLVMLVAISRVILPYDEWLTGLTLTELGAINPRLLAFMAHDRISLSGTMAAVGLLYLYLAWYPLRRGEHWARQTLLVSGAVGFATFFYFLGYGYFDPLHLLVSLPLLFFYLMGLWQSRTVNTPLASANRRNDAAWRMAQWGQLLLIALGAAIMVAGATISVIGMTHVFVPDDLAYLQTTADELLAAHPRLVPLIAHDRAGFGGNLFCNGLTLLLLNLWGFRQGARWLWWANLLAGAASYLAALWTHFTVGYVDQGHLMPVYIGSLMLGAALTLAGPYLLRTGPAR